MANSSKRYGVFAYGDVYDFDKSTNGRGKLLGKLIVDDDREFFYIKKDDEPARRINHERVNWMLANDLIEFYHEDSRDRLLDYMMNLEAHKNSVREAQMNAYKNAKATKALNESKKLIKKTKRRARLAKVFWLAGCGIIIGIGVIASIPQPEPAPAEQSIAGVGSDYGIDSSLLKNATSLSALGNGSTMYGLVFDDNILESGQQNSNESTIKENVLVNSNVSSTYPIHLRPLYYDRSTFYQSQLRLNDTAGGSNAIMLQNPNGYSLGYAANEIVLIGGQGMSSVTISAPDAFQASSASDAAKDIEQAQQEAAQKAANPSSSTSTKKDDTLAAEMPDKWNGYDYADIDDKKIAASYWYTKNSTLKKEDLHRRVVIWDISSVLNKGEDGLSDMEPIQMNYQDLSSDFYNPIISESPSSNGATYWVGYMKKSANGNTGFYIRKYEDADDILMESYDNTFSTKDLTGSDFPITNYTLYGDYLFFEQQGYIWVMDLSKTQITVDGNKRTIKKENPIKICKASEIRPTVTRDEQFIASETNATTVPVSHYQVMRITTANGVETGISFIEAESGNLIFQPINGATVAATGIGGNAQGNQNQTKDVSSGNQAALDKSIAENEARNANANGNNNSNNKNGSNNSSGSGNGGNGNGANNGQSSSSSTDSSSSGNRGGASGDAIVSNSDNGSDGDTGPKNMISGLVNGIESVGQSSYDIEQSAYTLSQAADENNEVDNGRILIRAGSSDTQIIAFCVRGEQFYWIEENQNDGTRKLMLSPVYYKNDASKLLSTDVSNDDHDATNGINANEGKEDGTKTTSADTAIVNEEQKPADEKARKEQEEKQKQEEEQRKAQEEQKKQEEEKKKQEEQQQQQQQKPTIDNAFTAVD